MLRIRLKKKKLCKKIFKNKFFKILCLRLIWFNNNNLMEMVQAVIEIRIRINIKRVRNNIITNLTILTLHHITITIIILIKRKKCFKWTKIINKGTLIRIITQIKWWWINNKWINRCFKYHKTFKIKTLSKTRKMVKIEIQNTSKKNI